MEKKAFSKFKIPDKPGVYFFMQNGKIIYIGKATSLKSRVRSYFSPDLIDTRGPVTVDAVFKADNIKWEATDSVLEALILEANLIKKYQPHYNIREKDDKSFNYVCITKEKLPRILVRRGRLLQNQHADFPRLTLKGSDTKKNLHAGFAGAYGPYPKGQELKEALKIIRRIFPFLDEKSKTGYEFYKQVNLAPDISTKEAVKLYKNNIRNIKFFFEGKKKRILQNLQRGMKEYAKKREFERAGEIKRQIFALQHINDVALLKNEPYQDKNSFRIEAYDIAHMSGKSMVGVMTVVENGNAVKSEYKRFKIRTQSGANDTGALKEVLERRLAHNEWRHPNLIVVDGGQAQINVRKKLFEKVGVSIPVVSVLKDERHRPKNILGDKNFALKYEKEILLANSESHRFAIAYHKNLRGKNFLP